MKKTKQSIHDKMLNLIKEYWDIKTGIEQECGSLSDIYAERYDEDIEFFMCIDDGNCDDELNHALYHIYVSNINGKIFEGRITSLSQFKTVMKVLGFRKKKVTNK